MSLLAAILGIDPQVLQLLAALFSVLAAGAGFASAVHGFLNRRLRKQAKTAADSTLVAVQTLTTLLSTRNVQFDGLWAKFLEKDTIANPEGVRRIATETTKALVEAELRPMRQYFAAVEIADSRRDHRPQTDTIRILEEITAS